MDNIPTAKEATGLSLSALKGGNPVFSEDFSNYTAGLIEHCCSKGESHTFVDCSRVSYESMLNCRNNLHEKGYYVRFFSEKRYGQYDGLFGRVNPSFKEHRRSSDMLVAWDIPWYIRAFDVVMYRLWAR